MGAGDEATEIDLERASQLGKLVAHRGWTLLTGGRRSGVMHAASKAAKEHGGLVIGILPGANMDDMSEFVDIPIITDMGSARNNINVLSSKVIVACGMGPGTASEISLALKAKKSVVLLCSDEKAHEFFKNLCPDLVTIADTADEAIDAMVALLENAIESTPWKRPEPVAACADSITN